MILIRIDHPYLTVGRHKKYVKSQTLNKETESYIFSTYPPKRAQEMTQESPQVSFFLSQGARESNEAFGNHYHFGVTIFTTSCSNIGCHLFHLKPFYLALPLDGWL
jgi:hypothetical protein